MVRWMFLCVSRKWLAECLHEAELVELVMANVPGGVVFRDDAIGYWSALGREISTLQWWGVHCKKILAISFGLSSWVYKMMQCMYTLEHLEATLDESFRIIHTAAPYIPPPNSCKFGGPATNGTNKRKRATGTRRFARTLTAEEVAYMQCFALRLNAMCVNVRTERENLCFLANHSVKTLNSLRMAERAFTKLTRFLNQVKIKE